MVSLEIVFSASRLGWVRLAIQGSWWDTFGYKASSTHENHREHFLDTYKNALFRSRKEHIPRDRLPEQSPPLGDEGSTAPRTTSQKRISQRKDSVITQLESPFVVAQPFPLRQSLTIESASSSSPHVRASEQHETKEPERPISLIRELKKRDKFCLRRDPSSNTARPKCTSHPQTIWSETLRWPSEAWHERIETFRLMMEDPSIDHMQLLRDDFNKSLRAWHKSGKHMKNRACCQPKYRRYSRPGEATAPTLRASGRYESTLSTQELRIVALGGKRSGQRRLAYEARVGLKGFGLSGTWDSMEAMIYEVGYDALEKFGQKSPLRKCMMAKSHMICM